jgi:hypothetical protein
MTNPYKRSMAGGGVARNQAAQGLPVVIVVRQRPWDRGMRSHADRSGHRGF